MKKFSQIYLLDPLSEDASFLTKRMFGGLAAYYRGLMVACLMEGDDPEWNGLLIPTSREHHAALLKEFPGLVPHPVLGKWLYLSLASEAHESFAQSLVECIRRRDPRFGIVPGEKKKKRAPKRAVK